MTVPLTSDLPLHQLFDDFDRSPTVTASRQRLRDIPAAVRAGTRARGVTTASLALGALSVADGATSYVVVGHSVALGLGHSAEANPLMRALMDAVGLGPAMAFRAVFGVAMAGVLWWLAAGTTKARAVLCALVVALGLVVVHNTTGVLEMRPVMAALTVEQAELAVSELRLQETTSRADAFAAGQVPEACLAAAREQLATRSTLLAWRQDPACV